MLSARERVRAELTADITAAARRQLAEVGAAGLSLRAVARDLGMVSSAVYRYFPSRDDLLTRLIIDGYDDLGAAADAPHDPTAPPAERWLAVCRAVRTWARSHPHEYALLYGSPVPDYRAPAEQTNEPGTRVQALLVALLADARRAGRLSNAAARFAPGSHDLAEAAASHLLDDPFFADAGLDASTVMAGLAAWTLLLGTVTTELFEQLGDTIPDPGAYFDFMLELAGRLVLGPLPVPVHS